MTTRHGRMARRVRSPCPAPAAIPARSATPQTASRGKPPEITRAAPELRGGDLLVSAGRFCGRTKAFSPIEGWTMRADGRPEASKKKLVAGAGFAPGDLVVMNHARRLPLHPPLLRLLPPWILGKPIRQRAIGPHWVDVGRALLPHCGVISNFFRKRSQATRITSFTFPNHQY